MPQLDKVTFLSQFFWLCFFFLGFFYVVSKYYLPQIGRILALRKQKMASGEGLSPLQENQQVRENSELLFSNALVTSKSLLKSLFSRTTVWLDTHTTLINESHFHDANASYVHSLGETSLSQNLLFYHAANNAPEKLAFKILLDRLRSLSAKKPLLSGPKGSGPSQKGFFATPLGVILPDSTPFEGPLGHPFSPSSPSQESTPQTVNGEQSTLETENGLKETHTKSKRIRKK